MGDWSAYVAPGVFVAILLAAAVSDVARRKIPNWAVLGLIGLYVVIAVLGLAPTGPWSALGAALIAFPITYGLYHFDVMGAGDAKLFTAAALFAGLKFLLPLALITALFGGAIAIGYLVVRPKRVMRGLTAAGRAEGPGIGIPYGIPIGLAAVSVGLLNGFVNFG
ncbi:MAG: prepilin peptidase [Ignavibacteriales bacterium]